jgi:osmotically-inducible protein OsmY
VRIRMTSKVIEANLQKAMKKMEIEQVEVTCDKQGNVELKGTVANYEEFAIASAIARTTPGVVEVINQLTVPS